MTSGEERFYRRATISLALVFVLVVNEGEKEMCRRFNISVTVEVCFNISVTVDAVEVCFNISVTVVLMLLKSVSTFL